MAETNTLPAIKDEVSIKSSHLSPTFPQEEIEGLLIMKKRQDGTDTAVINSHSTYNLTVILRHRERYRKLFRFDRFAQQILVFTEPPWHLKEETFRIRAMTDRDLTCLMADMERNEDMHPSVQNLISAVSAIAEENWINPPLEYFEGLVWDKVPRIGTWLKDYLGAEGDEEYLSAVGASWLIAGVSRIYNPGNKAESMLVLEGGQGTFKSTALKILASVGNGDDREEYFCDTLTFSEIRNKDTILKLRGKFIIEFAELANLGNREVEEVKSFMSTTTDECRPPYGRSMVKFPRGFIFAGSTNDSLWLKDQTGNRRFWPVKVGRILIEMLEADKEQLWAEAVWRYKNKAKWWIGKQSPVWEKAEIEQDLRLLEDIWTSPVEDYCDGKTFLTVQEVLEERIKIDVADQNKQHQARVISILKRLKYVPKVKYHGGKTVRGWHKELRKPKIEEQEIFDI